MWDIGVQTHMDGPQWRTLRERADMGRSHRIKRALPIAGAILAMVVACSGAHVRAGDDAAGLAYFESKIRPVLVERCYECHSSGAKKLRGGLRLDTREGIRAGGHTGPAVVPGNLDESLLFQAISGAQGVDRMPPKGALAAGVSRRLSRVDQDGGARPAR